MVYQQGPLRRRRPGRLPVVVSVTGTRTIAVRVHVLVRLMISVLGGSRLLRSSRAAAFPAGILANAFASSKEPLVAQSLRIVDGVMRPVAPLS